MRILNEEEMKNIVAGEGITVLAVMAILVSAIVAVVLYKMFMSSKGTATVPGGWKFTWN